MALSHSNSVMSNLSLQCLSKTILSEFRGAIEGSHSSSNLTGNRNDVHDLSTTLVLQLYHLRQKSFYESDARQSIDVHQSLSDDKIRVYELISLGNSTVVNKNINMIALAITFSEFETCIRVPKI